MKTINVGIIGCGGFGNFHLDNLLQMEGVSIVALVSSNPKRLEETAKKVPNARLYSGHKELFADDILLDAVVVSLPPALHHGVECAAAQLGVNIYVEKPIGVDIATALKNAEAIEKAGIICAVGYQGRYSSLFPKLKTVIARQQIGLVLATWIGGFPEVMWWRNKSLSGGQLVEQATHLFDIMRYLFGEVKSVYSSAMSGINDKPNSTVEDCSSTVVTFKSGIVATMLTGCYISNKSPSDVGLQIFCKDMQISYDWCGDIQYKSNDETTKISPIGNAHFDAMQAFITALQSGDKTGILCDYADAVKTLKVTLAANQSMESGLPIMLD